jgi:hypothetical protein
MDLLAKLAPYSSCIDPFWKLRAGSSLASGIVGLAKNSPQNLDVKELRY